MGSDVMLCVCMCVHVRVRVRLHTVINMHLLKNSLLYFNFTLAELSLPSLRFFLSECMRTFNRLNPLGIVHLAQV